MCRPCAIIATTHRASRRRGTARSRRATTESSVSLPSREHLIAEGWQQPRGHQSCPTGAMRAVKLDDAEMARMAREEGLEVIRPELNARPRVYYRNLWRYAKCFIGGTVSVEANGTVDCVEGALVRLIKAGT